MRTPVVLYLIALGVRASLALLFPDAAYPDSAYYVEVARSIAAGHGLSVNFVWIFAEVGNRIPDPAVLPIASNAHWLPLASFIQAPFISLLGPTAIASAIPMILVGSLVAPLTWLIARDAGARPLVATTAGLISAVPGAVTVLLAQPETIAIQGPIVAAALWLTARGLKGDGRSFAVAGLLAGLASLARVDGVLLAGTVGLVWLADRLRWWRNRHGRQSWARVDDRLPIPVLPGLLALVGFLVLMVPWWARQIATFGSISPTTSNGAALWIRSHDEWNSITAAPSFQAWLAQGIPAIIGSRLVGLTAAATQFAVLVCGVVLLPFVLIGALARRHSPDFQPWFAFAFVTFAAATFVYPLHAGEGTFIHTAIGLAPHASILAVEGLLLVLSLFGGRGRRSSDGRPAVMAAGLLVIVMAGSAVAFARSTQAAWAEVRDQRVALATELDRLGAPQTDRLMSIDAGSIAYWTGHPGIVTPSDPLDTIQAAAKAYEVRWLVLERTMVVPTLAPILAGGPRPSWIGPPAFTLPSNDGGPPRLALYPVCASLGDPRCSGG
ncbi:MAG TPA: glycosyltransferase family 39 protein [Candidatus Limnocylindrales bacterium]|nr:glycosyltransferase family 39 protein [Candidatus Limnocylindrales bacterium]